MRLLISWTSSCLRRPWGAHRIRSTPGVSGDLIAAIAELEVLADLDAGSELRRAEPRLFAELAASPTWDAHRVSCPTDVQTSERQDDRPLFPRLSLHERRLGGGAGAGIA